MAKKRQTTRKQKRLTKAEKEAAGLAPRKRKPVAKKKVAKKKAVSAARKDRSKSMSRITQYREALQEALTVNDLKLVMKEIIRQAKKGNLDACKIVLERAVGKPLQPTTSVQLDAQTLANETREYLKDYLL